MGQILVPPFDRKVAAEGFEPGVVEVGVLDAGQAAAWKEPDGRAAGAGGAGKAVRRTGEVVDQGVIPVVHEFSDHADARATDVDPVIETLRGSRSGIGAGIVNASIEVHAADNRYAILIVWVQIVVRLFCIFPTASDGAIWLLPR